MDFKLPELGEGVYEAEAVRWLVKPGDAVKPGQTLLEVLTDKATMEVPAPFAGVIESLGIEGGDKIKIGQVILSYQTKRGELTTPAPTPTPTVMATEPKATRDNGAPTRAAIAVKAAPSVRLMARKLGIDLAAIAGSGPHGRVLIDDLSQHVPQAKAPSTPTSTGLDLGKAGTRVKFAGLRRKIAEHMVHSKHTIPHYSYVDECDVTELVKLRESLKETFAKKGAKLTFLAFFVKAVAHALREVPIVNATLDEAAGEIVLYDRYHVGVAVAAPGGLIVPVIRDADKKSVLDIAKEIDRLSADARAGKSKLDDLRDGTFTVTSIGNIGGLFATPIIHTPQVGILGLGKIVSRPIFDVRGQVVPAEMLYLSFSFDHRVLDGALGATFGNAVIARLKNAAALLVD